MKKKRKRVKRPRTRVRSVSFLGIEGNAEARDTLFMRETRDALANQVQSPLDRLIEEEEVSEEQKRAIQTLRRLRRYAKYARLTPKQKQAYELFFITKRSNMTLRKLAKKLKISPSSAWARINGAITRLEKVKQRQEEGRQLRNVLDGVLYAGKLKKVFRLYFDRGWPPQAVAKSLHCNLSTIYSNIRLIRHLGDAYSHPKKRI